MPVRRAAEGARTVLPPEPAKGRDDAVSTGRTGRGAAYGGRRFDRAPRTPSRAPGLSHDRDRSGQLHVRRRGPVRRGQLPHERPGPRTGKTPRPPSILIRSTERAASRHRRGDPAVFWKLLAAVDQALGHPDAVARRRRTAPV